jgi:PAS domain S-box-containing protein
LNSQLIPQLRTTLGWALVAVLAATLVSSVGTRLALAPLGRISQQLDRLSRGEFQSLGLDRSDELGQVSSQIDRLGQELSTYRTGYRSLKDNVDQIMTGLQEGLMLFSREGRAIMVSPSVEKFLGVKSEAFLGRPIQEIFLPGSAVARALGLAHADLSPVENLEIELEGDSPRRAALSVQIIAERGEKLGALVTLRDIESIERLGSQFEISERLAAISRVTAGVAHEVKNPLNAMSLHLGQLRSKLPADGSITQHLQVLENEISRLNRAVDTFRNFTRPVDLRLADTDLHALVMEVFALARPQAEASHVAIVVEQPQALPLVRVDRDLIKQALLNLVLNGCQAMPGGGTLTIRLCRDDHHVEIWVRDTGTGIAPENRKKIFQLFFSTKPGGSGVGLANTFRIVQLHNGSIDFESEVGRGTTFRMRLPPR